MKIVIKVQEKREKDLQRLGKKGKKLKEILKTIDKKEIININD